MIVAGSWGTWLFALGVTAHAPYVILTVVGVGVLCAVLELVRLYLEARKEGR